VRIRTGPARRYKKVENATAVIWRVLMVVERNFRKLNAPHLLPAVAAGRVYVNGHPTTKDMEDAA